jgi:hypothetical protein
VSGKPRVASGEYDDLLSAATLYTQLAIFVLAAMEAAFLDLVFMWPRPYGSSHPGFHFLLGAGIAALLAGRTPLGAMASLFE